MLFLLLFFIISSVLIASLVFWVATRAIIFARATLALCIALLLSQSDCILIPNHGFLNFLAWAIISFGVIYFLSILPRADVSIQFLCTMIVSLVVTELVGTLIGNIFVKNFEMTALYEITIKLVCIGTSLFGIYIQGKKLSSESSSHILVRFVDRLLASLLYGISFFLICFSFHNNWVLPPIVQLIVLIAIIVGTYVADLFLANKVLFGNMLAEAIEIPR